MARRPSGALKKAEAINYDIEATLGDVARVELLERARRGVSGVGKGLLASGNTFLVDAGKLHARKVNFAANLEELRTVLHSRAKIQRQTFDGAQVGGDVVARRSIATRCADRENTAFVS